MVVFKSRLFSSHATRLHKRGLNSCNSSYAFSYPFIVLHKQSNESSWRSRDLHRDILFPMYCVHIVVCAFAHLSISFSPMLVVVSLLGISSMYLLLWVKRYYYYYYFLIVTIYYWSRTPYADVQFKVDYRFKIFFTYRQSFCRNLLRDVQRNIFYFNYFLKAEVCIRTYRLKTQHYTKGDTFYSNTDLFAVLFTYIHTYSLQSELQPIF